MDETTDSGVIVSCEPAVSEALGIDIVVDHIFMDLIRGGDEEYVRLLGEKTKALYPQEARALAVSLIEAAYEVERRLP